VNERLLAHQHNHQDNRDKHHEPDGNGYSNSRLADWPVANDFAGMSVDQHPVVLGLIGVGVDPDRQVADGRTPVAQRDVSPGQPLYLLGALATLHIPDTLLAVSRRAIFFYIEVLWR